MDRSLSKNEAKVILDLEWRGQKIVTLAGLREALDASESYARFLAHRLVRKGWLERLRPGLFRLIPADRGREGVADANPLTAGAALVSPYFFSFGTACTHHGLTERFFGFKELTVLGEPVQMATVERALLDALDRPQHAGGLGEVSRIVARASTRVSWPGLLELARRWQVPAILQRLGFLLDLHQASVPEEVRRKLLELTRQAGKIHLGPRVKWGNAGKLASPWKVVANVPRDVLISKTDRPRRRVVFHKERGAE